MSVDVNSRFGRCLHFLVVVCTSKGVVSVDVSLSLWCEGVTVIVCLWRFVKGGCGDDCPSGLINGVVSVVASVLSLVLSVSVVTTQSLSSLVESLSCSKSVSGM